MLATLKKKVIELNEKLAEKEKENDEFKIDLKVTKVRELQTEAKVYMQECVRLRKLLDTFVTPLGSKKGAKTKQKLELLFSENQELSENLNRAQQEVGMLHSTVTELKHSLAKQRVVNDTESKD